MKNFEDLILITEKIGSKVTLQFVLDHQDINRFELKYAFADGWLSPPDIDDIVIFLQN